jgi:hypothetical protein
MTERRLRLESMHNAMLNNLDSRLDDIGRIAHGLPTETDDEKIVAMTMLFMAGWLHARRADAVLMESEMFE